MQDDLKPGILNLTADSRIKNMRKSSNKHGTENFLFPRYRMLNVQFGKHLSVINSE